MVGNAYEVTRFVPSSGQTGRAAERRPEIVPAGRCDSESRDFTDYDARQAASRARSLADAKEWARGLRARSTLQGDGEILIPDSSPRRPERGRRRPLFSRFTGRASR